MQFLASILFLAASALAADVGASGVLSTLDGGLKGTVTVKNANTLMITGYTLEDASAPDLYWWGSETSNLGSGFRINSKKVTTAASNEDTTVALDAGKTASQFSYVGLWCERLSVNFGQAQLVGGGGSGSGTGASETSSAAGATDTASSKSGAGKVGAGALAVAAAFAAFLA